MLVEYPLSRTRLVTAGRFFGKWGRQYRGVYNLRKVSVVLLVENNQHKSAISSAAKIYWKKWCELRVKEKYLYSARQIVINSSFTKTDEQIAVCDLQGTDQNSSRLIFDVYISNLDAQVLDVNTQMIDIFDLMKCARALKKELESKKICVGDYEFLAYCDDLKWLAKRYLSHIPKPFRTLVKEKNEKKAKDDVSEIKSKLSSNTSKSHCRLLKNDLCEAKDRLHPRRRFFWVLLHYTKPLILLLLPFLIIFIFGFLLGIIAFFQIDIAAYFMVSLISSGILGFLVFIYLLIKKVIGMSIRLAGWIRWFDEGLETFSRIEESRSRKFEEYYVSTNCQTRKSISNTPQSPKQIEK